MALLIVVNRTASFDMEVFARSSCPDLLRSSANVLMWDAHARVLQDTIDPVWGGWPRRLRPDKFDVVNEIVDEVERLQLRRDVAPDMAVLFIYDSVETLLAHDAREYAELERLRDHLLSENLDRYSLVLRAAAIVEPGDGASEDRDRAIEFARRNHGPLLDMLFFVGRPRNRSDVRATHASLRIAMDIAAHADTDLLSHLIGDGAGAFAIGEHLPLHHDTNPVILRTMFDEIRSRRRAEQRSGQTIDENAKIVDEIVQTLEARIEAADFRLDPPRAEFGIGSDPQFEMAAADTDAEGRTPAERLARCARTFMETLGLRWRTAEQAVAKRRSEDPRSLDRQAGEHEERLTKLRRTLVDLHGDYATDLRTRLDSLRDKASAIRREAADLREAATSAARGEAETFAFDPDHPQGRFETLAWHAIDAATRLSPFSAIAGVVVTAAALWLAPLLVHLVANAPAGGDETAGIALAPLFFWERLSLAMAPVLFAGLAWRLARKRRRRLAQCLLDLQREGAGRIADLQSIGDARTGYDVRGFALHELTTVIEEIRNALDRSVAGAVDLAIKNRLLLNEDEKRPATIERRDALLGGVLRAQVAAMAASDHAGLVIAGLQAYAPPQADAAMSITFLGENSQDVPRKVATSYFAENVELSVKELATGLSAEDYA